MQEANDIVERLVIQWNPLYGWPLVGAVVVSALVLVGVWFYRERRRARSGRLVLLLLLRLVVIAGFALLLLRPEVVRQKVRQKKVPLIVMLDASASMQIEDKASGVSRWRLEREAVKGAEKRIETLSKSYDIHAFLFGDRPVEVSLSDVLKMDKPTEVFPKTEIVKSVEGVMRRFSQDQIRSARFVLLSDWSSQDAVEGEDVVSVMKRLAEAKGGLGVMVDPPEIKDISIRNVISVPYGYVKNPAPVRVFVENQNMGEITVSVTLHEGRDVVAAESVALRPNVVTEVTMKYLNGRVGDHVYEVRLQELEGEATHANNRAYFTTRVVRDKIRVLHVSGRPSWDQRFLREALVGNPEIELISFYILRTLQNDPDASTRELSLIPFPYEELFTTEIGTFDVIIFQNFNYNVYFRIDYLANIETYVREGGAFFMIGGEQSFTMGGYAKTPIEAILPVRLSDKDRSSSASFRPEIAAIARAHPLVRDLIDQRTIGRLPSFTGANWVEGSKPGSDVILVHPFLKLGNGERLPVLAAAGVGKGRTISLLVDSLWRWKMTSDETSRSVYDGLIKRSLKWLTHDPLFERYRLAVDAGEAVISYAGSEAPRDELVLNAFAVDAGEKKPAEAVFSKRIRWGRADCDSVRGECVRREAVNLQKEGIYRWVLSKPGAVSEPLAEALRVTGSDDEEIRRLRPDYDNFKKFMSASGGRSVIITHSRSGNIFQDVDAHPETDQIVIGQKSVAVWDRLWVMLALLFVSLLQWGLSRRWNL